MEIIDIMERDEIAKGCTIEVKRCGNMSPIIYKLTNNNIEIAELEFENNFKRKQAFYKTSDSKFELKNDLIMAKHQKQVLQQGVELARLETNIMGRKGYIITRWKHRYKYELGFGWRPKTVVKREVGNQEIFNVITDYKRHRVITVNPTTTELQEVHILLSITLFHLVLLG